MTKHDPGIFDRMVGIYFCIAFDADGQVKKSVTGKAVQHMIKKRDSGVNLIFPMTIQVDGQFDIGFFCLSFTACNAVLFHILPTPLIQILL